MKAVNFILQNKPVFNYLTHQTKAVNW